MVLTSSDFLLLTSAILPIILFAVGSMGRSLPRGKEWIVVSLVTWASAIGTQFIEKLYPLQTVWNVAMIVLTIITLLSLVIGYEIMKRNRNK